MNIHPSENTPDVHADSGADNNVPSLNRVVLQGGGRGIDESGNIPVEIADDRKGDDFFHNRPSTQLRQKILALPEEPGVYLYIDRNGKVVLASVGYDPEEFDEMIKTIEKTLE